MHGYHLVWGQGLVQESSAYSAVNTTGQQHQHLVVPHGLLDGGDALGLPVLQTKGPSQATHSCQEVGKYFSAMRGKINLCKTRFSL